MEAPGLKINPKMANKQELGGFLQGIILILILVMTIIYYMHNKAALQ